MSKDFMYPKAGSIRGPTDNAQNNGRIVNPPRLNQMGGFDKLKEKYGLFKNDKHIRKPGGTK